MNGREKQKEQSRQMIENALFSLLAEKEYSKITISELVQRADVARKTFYRLYESKEEVLYTYFQKLCMEYRNSCTTIGKYDISQIAREFFSFWYQYKDVLLLLQKRGLGSMVYASIHNFSGTVIRGRITDDTLQSMVDISYFMDYSTGGFINLLHRWMENGMQEPPERYAQVVSEAISKFIQPTSGNNLN